MAHYKIKASTKVDLKVKKIANALTVSNTIADGIRILRDIKNQERQGKAMHSRMDEQQLIYRVMSEKAASLKKDLKCMHFSVAEKAVKQSELAKLRSVIGKLPNGDTRAVNHNRHTRAIWNLKQQLHAFHLDCDNLGINPDVAINTFYSQKDVFFV